MREIVRPLLLDYWQVRSSDAVVLCVVLSWRKGRKHSKTVPVRTRPQPGPCESIDCWHGQVQCTANATAQARVAGPAPWHGTYVRSRCAYLSAYPAPVLFLLPKNFFRRLTPPFAPCQQPYKLHYTTPYTKAPLTGHGPQSSVTPPTWCRCDAPDEKERFLFWCHVIQLGVL